MIYPRLCVAYFTLFAIWGAWAGALGGYAAELALPGWQIGWLYSAIPLGAIIAPLFIGPIADRYFPAQIISGVLHLVGGLCLLGCGAICVGATPEAQPNFIALATLMILSGICFMPTIALINSIVFKHLPNASSAPYVFIFGTAGWIIVNLFIDLVCGGAKNPNFFFVGGGLSIFLAIYCTTLPHTPPKGAPAPGEKSDALGLGALKLLFQDRNFLIFVVCVFLVGIPACNYYFPAMVPYLTDSGYDNALTLTTINQFSELAFMALLPLCIARFGLKNVLLLGMGAWALRYFLFTVPALAIPGLLLHGLAYAFFYVAAYTYADKKAPPELKASVQCFMVFLLLGVGQVLGGQLYGFTSDTFVTAGEETVKNWSMIFGVPAIFFTVMTVIFFVVGKDPKEPVAEEKEKTTE